MPVQPFFLLLSRADPAQQYPERLKPVQSTVQLMGGENSNIESNCEAKPHNSYQYIPMKLGTQLC